MQGDRVTGQPVGHGEVAVAGGQLGEDLLVDCILGVLAEVLACQRHFGSVQAQLQARVEQLRIRWKWNIDFDPNVIDRWLGVGPQMH